MKRFPENITRKLSIFLCVCLMLSSLGGIALAMPDSTQKAFESEEQEEVFWYQQPEEESESKSETSSSETESTKESEEKQEESSESETPSKEENSEKVTSVTNPSEENVSSSSSEQSNEEREEQIKEEEQIKDSQANQEEIESESMPDESTEQSEQQSDEIKTIVIPDGQIPLEYQISTISTFSANDTSALSDEVHLGQLAKISDVRIQSRTTGTAPFDSNDQAGNDSSADNNIIRSFDSIHYDLTVTTAIKESAGQVNVKGGNLMFYAEIPNNDLDAQWDKDSLQWVQNLTYYNNGKGIRGYYNFDSNTVSAPGNQSLTFDLKVNGAKNGDTFSPVFTFYLDGCDAGEEVSLTDNSITVSAYPRYNVVLNWDTGTAAYRGTEMAIDGEDYKVYNVGVGFQLYGESPEKGMKGIELPTGNIEFDLVPKLTKLAHKDDPSSGGSDVTDIYTKVLTAKYNTKGFYKSDFTNPDYFDLLKNNLTSEWSIASSHLPLSSGAIATDSTDRTIQTYNSGTINLTGNHMTISNYSVDGTFPHRWASSGSKNDHNFTDNIGFISVANVFYAVSLDAYDIDSTNCYFEVEAKNLTVKSLTNISGTDLISTDNKLGTMHVEYSSGTMSFHNYPYNVDYSTKVHKGRKSSSIAVGDGYASVGEKMALCTGISLGDSNPLSGNVGGWDMLVKFDDEAWEPVVFDDGSKVGVYDRWYNLTDKFTINTYYAGKTDKTGWSDDVELIAAKPSDLVYFDSLEKLKEAGYTCVAVLHESTSGTLERGEQVNLFTPVKVKNSAVVGNVYAFQQATNAWTVSEWSSDFRTKYSASNYLGGKRNVSYPTAKYRWNPSYEKTVYTNSAITGGHTPGYMEGNSVLIVQGYTKITKKVTNTNADQSEKTVFDLSKNETVVDYALYPSYTGSFNSSKKETMTVFDYLPAGTTYKKGSCNIGDPKIESQSDGSTKLTWEITGAINTSMDPITYQVDLDQTAPSGTVYENRAVISAPEIDSSVESFRADSVSISVVNLTGHRIYKEALKETIQPEGIVEFKLHYLNMTDQKVDGVKMLDILPYNGDDRGTNFHGTYSVTSLILSKKKAGTSFKVYGTTNSSARTLTVDQVNPSEWTYLGDSNSESIPVNSSLTAIYIEGNFESYDEMTLYMALDPTNCQKDDIYYNDFNLLSSTDSAIVDAVPVYTKVVDESIPTEPTIPENIKGKITVTKRINAEDLIKNVDDGEQAYGDPTFIFLLEGDNGMQYHRSVTFTKENVAANTDSDGYARLSATFDNLELGNYQLSERKVLRYRFDGISEVENGTVNDQTVQFTLTKENRTGAATFTNKITGFNGNSHTTSVTNHITGHDWEEDYTVDKKASCTVAGQVSIHCKDCNVIKPGSKIELPALGSHTWGDWETITDGWERRECSVCGATQTRQN